MSRSMRVLCAAALALAALPTTVQAQQATIAGRVTDASAGVPIPGVQVTVVGTNLGAVTNEEGRYTIRAVPAGTVGVRALRIGYAERTQTVAAAAGTTTTLDFTMRPAPVNLSPVVTTAAGAETRREEVGHTDYSFNAAKVVEQGPVANMTDLLTARAPSVQVLNSTATGAGARVRVRGASSLSLNNEPIYIIDGVRMTANTSSIAGNIFTGGQAPSRVGDLNPEEIESIEVVPGPSASTLYGTDAANGVIVITTKRGRAGRTQFSTYAETGWIRDFHDYPTAYSIIGVDTLNPNRARSLRLCSLSDVSLRRSTSTRQCGVADTLSSFNLFETDETNPLTTGRRGQYGFQMRGGSEAVRFFSSAEFEQEYGIQTIPEFDLDRARTSNLTVLDEWLRPNSLQKVSARGNLNAQLTQKSDLAISTGFIRSSTYFAQSENNALGLLSSAFGGPGYRDNGLEGYRAFTPLDIYQNVTNQGINRFIGSANLSYRPTTWLTGIAVVGADVVNRKDTELCRRGQCPDFGNVRDEGFKTDNRAWFYNYTANLSSTASFQPLEALGSKTTLGVQYVNSIFDGNGTYAENLAPGTSTVSAGATQYTSEFTTVSKTLGAFVEQSFSWAERLYLTAALRTDQNSAFGTNFQNVYYPKANVAWVVSRESFFPAVPGLSMLRLRAAYGASGRQPEPNDALRYFTSNTVSIERAASREDLPGVQFSALGNTALRPERSTEAEVGLELQLLEERVSLEATYYSKLSKDALIGEVIPPSVGSGNTTRRNNLGAVKNFGYENILRALVLDRPWLRWDLTATYNRLDNKLVSVGNIPFPPGTIIRNVIGYPLFGYWGQQIRGYNDANGDGILTANEIVVDAEPTYIGPSQPTRESVLSNTFELFDRMLSVTSLFDYKGGYIVRNGTERIRCQNRNNCAGMADPNASFSEQARAVALRDHPSRTSAGYNEKGDFVRFRELAFTFTPKREWAARFIRSESASLTLGLRNLYTWTDYTGLDPESNYGQDNVQNDFQTLPPPTYMTLRLNVGF